MKLSRELGLNRDIENLTHEALLSIYHTASRARKQSSDFFSDYGITDVQFNLLMLVRYQGGEKGALKQVDLSRMMLVNRANVTAIIDRLEKSGMAVRTAVPGDRRSHYVRLTKKGRALLDRVEKKYFREIDGIREGLDDGELKELVRMLEQVRLYLVGRDQGPRVKGGRETG